IREAYTGAHAGAKFMVDNAAWRILDEPISPVWTMNEDQLRAQLPRLEAYFRAIAASWRRGDSLDRLEELRTELLEGQFGALAMEARTPAAVYYRILMETRREVEGLKQKLERIEKEGAR